MPGNDIFPDLGHLDKSLEPQVASDQHLTESGSPFEPSSPLFRSSPNHPSEQYSVRKQNGQMIYGGPPPDWIGAPPPKGTEVFFGKIPREFTIEDLVPIFDGIGQIYELRLLMDFSGCNRGYGFVRYTTIEAAKKAVRKLDNFEIKPHRRIGVMISEDNRKLWISPVPENLSLEQIRNKLDNKTPGVIMVTLHSSKQRPGRHYIIVQYESHRAASLARRILIPNNCLFDQKMTEIEWAKSHQDADNDVNSQTCSLFVRNMNTRTSAEKLFDVFSQFCPDQLCRVDKTKDFAFIHFNSHKAAKIAFEAAQKGNIRIDHTKVEVSWSHHPEFRLNKKKRLPRTTVTAFSQQYTSYPRQRVINYPVPLPQRLPYFALPLYGLIYNNTQQCGVQDISLEDLIVPLISDSNIPVNLDEPSQHQGNHFRGSNLVRYRTSPQDSGGNSPSYNSQPSGPSSFRSNVIVFAPAPMSTDQIRSSYGAADHSQMESSYGSSFNSYMGAGFGSSSHSYTGASNGSSGHSSSVLGHGSVTSPVNTNFSSRHQTMVFDAAGQNNVNCKETTSPTTSAENPDSLLFFNEQSVTNF